MMQNYRFRNSSWHNQYYFLLREASKKSSLVSIKAQQHIINHHFLLSFIFADFIRRTSEKKTVSILDLGSGNGFPAIILALCFENAKFTIWIDALSLLQNIFLAV